MDFRAYLLRPLPLVLVGSAALNGLLWLLIFWLFPKQTPAAVLHYTSLTGIDFVGSGRQIYALPIIGGVLLVGNAIIGRLVEPVSRQAAWMLYSVTIPIQCILLGAFLLLWRANT